MVWRLGSAEWIRYYCRGEWNCVVSFIMLVAPPLSTKICLWTYNSIATSLYYYFNIHQYIVRHWLVLTTMESNCWVPDETAWSPVAWLEDVGHNATAVSVELDLVLLSESTLLSPIWWIDRRLLCCSHRRAIHLPLICRVVAWLVARNTSSY